MCVGFEGLTVVQLRRPWVRSVFSGMLVVLLGVAWPILLSRSLDDAL